MRNVHKTTNPQTHKYTKPLVDNYVPIIFALGILIILLQALNLVIGKHIEERGIDLYKTQNEIKELDTQNAVLRAQVLKQESLTTIEQKARAEGMVNAEPLILWKHKKPSPL